MKNKKYTKGKGGWNTYMQRSEPECLDIWTTGTVKGNDITVSDFKFDNYEQAKKAADAFYWDRRKRNRKYNDSVVILRKRVKPSLLGDEWHIVYLYDDFIIDLDGKEVKQDDKRD